jgi:integrase
MTTASGKIGLKSLQGLKPREIIWDAQLKGFGARRSASGISFILMYRTREGRQRFYTIGKLGSPWSPERARDEAQKLLYEVKAGRDPAADKINARKGETIADLCKMYMDEAETGRLRIRGGREKKPTTLASDRSWVRGHIIPLLGQRKVAALTQHDVEEFMLEVARQSGKPTATRAVSLLGSMYTWAVKHKMRPDSPVRGVEKFADKVRDRRLTEDEYLTFGEAIRSSDAWPSIPLAAKFLALTGWRSNEALSLRRPDVDFERRTATLKDTKTGASMRPLAHRAIEVLRSVPITTGDLFFSSVGGKVLFNFSRIFKTLAPAQDVTPHTLRHSFASLANDLGFTDATVAAMLGHVKKTQTSRYQHSADAVLLKAADTVADETARLMGDAQAPARVIPLKA